jgi:hypothetical protein
VAPFFVPQISSDRSALNAGSKSCAKAFEKPKNARSAAEKQSTSVFSGCLRTDRSRDKLAFRSEIEFGLFFRANSEGRGEY